METRESIKIENGTKVFMACNDYFGYFGSGMYKDWSVMNGNCNHGGETFAVTYADAVNMLHEYLKENEEWIVKEYPKTKYSILMVDGSVDKYGELKHTEVYSITTAKAKKLLF